MVAVVFITLFLRSAFRVNVTSHREHKNLTSPSLPWEGSVCGFSHPSMLSPLELVLLSIHEAEGRRRKWVGA